MIFKDFKGLRLPMLGFGAMRLPTVKSDTGAEIDVKEAERMVELAMSSAAR